MSNVPLGSIAPSAPPVVPTPAPTPAAPAPAPAPRVAPNLIQDRPAAPPPAPPAPPPKAPEVEVKFNHRTLKVDPTSPDTIKYIQKGMAASKLDEERAQFNAWRKGQEDLVKVGEQMAMLAQQRPDHFRAIMDIASGRMPEPQRGEDPNDDPLTPPPQAHSVHPDVQRRLDFLEREFTKQRDSSHQRELQRGIDTALDRHKLRATAEEAELAQAFVERLLPEVGDPDQAAEIARQTIDRIISSRMEAERTAREANRSAAPVRSAAEPVSLPRLDSNVPTYAGLKSGQSRAKVSEWLKNLQRAVSGPQSQ